MTKTSEHENKEETITARCRSGVKKTLYLLSRMERRSMSEVLARSVQEYYQRHFPGKDFFEREKQLFGRYGSGIGDLSVNRKKYLKEKLREKHSYS